MAEDIPRQTATAADPNAPQASLQYIYLKDCSFESPEGPHLPSKEWTPKMELNLNTKSRELEDDSWEIVLAVRVEAKLGEKTAFLVELEQAGAFLIRNLPEDDMKRLLTAQGPAILFPYAREAIASLVSRGGFPQFLLPPVNFEAMVAQATAQQQTADH